MASPDGGSDAGGGDGAVPTPCPAGLAPGASRCNGDAVERCSAGATLDTVACGFGCLAAGADAGPSPRCLVPQPLGGILGLPDYKAATAITQLAAGNPYYANTDTGVIETRDVNGVAAPVRGGGAMSAGIAYYTVSQGVGKPTLGVWSFASLSVAQGATLIFEGSNVAGLVVLGDLSVKGVVSVRADCAKNAGRAGGGAGGKPTIAGSGATPGAGGVNDGQFGGNGSGGGGGGNGTAGTAGMGSPNSIKNGHGAAGPAAVALTSAPFVLGGGAGGGGGGATSAATTGGAGGAAAGALQLVVLGTFTLDGALDANGCGGGGARGVLLSGTDLLVGGGGGGSGGSVVVEAARVTFGPLARVVAIGGGGGGPSNTSSLGSPGTTADLGGAPAPGGAGTSVACGVGGTGSDGTTNTPLASTCFVGGTGNSAGGGGGGGAGQLVIRSLAGKRTIDPTSIVKPTPFYGDIAAQ